MTIVDQIRKKFDHLNIDGLLITKPENRRYLTGFTGTSGLVLISRKQALFITDSRYKIQAHDEVRDYDLIIRGRSDQQFSNLKDQIRNLGIKKLGVESSHMDLQMYLGLKKSNLCEIVPTTKLIETFRMIKNEDEISYIKEAAKIADDAFTHALKLIKPGVREIDISHEIEYYMRKQGATSNSSPRIIVASGVRSSLPHGGASDKVIENGDMITLDYGALYNGYRSDMTRTISVGKPDKELIEIYQIVYEALEYSKSKVNAGMLSYEVDSLSRDYITERGYGENFVHGGGHGIGLEIHEEPFFSQNSNTKIKPGMVVTIEPGIYIPQYGGVRIEDDVLIKDEGIEVLTHSPRNLIQL